MASSEQQGSPYLVLARKYRPSSFSALIGQDAMVQTLGNAFKANRIHHAFILTGVRGVGKTTTARILARAFNYEDETGRHPTLDLDREGVHCRAIIEGRHVDVVELDAASNTSINDVREIIDSIRYAPASAPYKVFIIDEVHMLSTAAFNGLLKTLEEPPPYVKFIFATTEIRKVPVTILSRCMRFDLRRVDAEVMSDHLKSILAREGIAFEDEALAMIVRAGEGSVRDCLSLLDQAIAYGDGAVRAEAVKTMLGLTDRAVIIDLFEALMAGRVADALGLLRTLYNGGADPETVLADLSDFTNLVARIKAVPEAADDATLTPDERRRGPELGRALSMRILTRAWQILFKGVEEVGSAGNPMTAAEMVLIRLAYAADLPTPDELIARLSDAPTSASPAPGGGGRPLGNGVHAMRAEPLARPAEIRPDQRPAPRAHSYADIVALAGANRDLRLKHALEAELRPLSVSEGRLEVALVEGADPGIIAQLSARLKIWTGRSWLVTVSNDPASVPTLRELTEQRHSAERAKAHADPLVQAVLETFPGAKIVRVDVKQDDAFALNPADPEEEDE